MRLPLFCSFFFFFFCSGWGLAQTSLSVPLNIREAINKGTRTVTGQPGEHYWQNRADYSIQVRFDPRTRQVSGTETIVYTNNSPDTLRQLLFKLYPNLYKKGAPRMQGVRPEDLTDGVAVSNLLIEGQKPATNFPASAAGTDVTIRIPATGPGRSVRVALDFSYTLNKTSHIRTGQVDSGAFFIAYFFPRIAVYDDIDGWNRNPYLGHLEFYNDFCRFQVEVTVPGDYMVWGTGDLVNRRELLSADCNQRIDEAETKDGVVTIVDTGDLARGDVLRGADSNTWKFQAADVTDFVFAVSDHYIWKSSSLVVDGATGRRTRVDAVFNPAHRDFYEVVDFARKTVEGMSYRFPAWPYPYPHETVFDGLDQMEYPMMVNDNPLSRREDVIELTDHEIFHTMFPFYMGTNETKYAWMDEGWASIGEWLISPMIDSTIVDEYGVSSYASLAGREVDLPIMTLSTQESGGTYFLNAYVKPAMGYLYAKDLLGDSLFRQGLHRYIRDWHGKHPMPLDFFGSMNAGSGRNLDWFWKRWFYDDGYPDLGIKEVQHKGGAAAVVVVNTGGKPVPVDLTIEFADGSKKNIHRSAAIWEKGNGETVIPVTSAKAISRVSLGSTYTPDSHPADNVWKAH
ncbi:MAG TPA: M1 family metallopeptidase [Puia sp.]|nr:M1 family metallopeptidase [Puia sp.]